MLYHDFLGSRVSHLGFGAMRLPLLEDGAVDEALTEQMIDRAMAAGINYYDTAYPYHGGMSERILGRLLEKYPRSSWYLADKYPGHQIADRYDPAEVFEEQLRRCRVDHFDYYLLHNIYENSLETYSDPQWGILPYFLEQREKGRIRHLGFSTHALPENLETVLERFGDQMEFCQIQLNYLDWTLQNAEKKVRMLRDAGLPIIVMEPLRGGKLAALPAAEHAKLAALRPAESDAAWSLHWLREIPEVKVILSGMSAPDQLEDNLKTFETDAPLSPAERELLAQIAETLKDSVPCTGCRYCCEGCPAGLDIPLLIRLYNDIKYTVSINTVATLEAMGDNRRPEACLACGLCAAVCPQGIDVPALMETFSGILKTAPSWAAISRERAEVDRRNREKN